MSQYDRATVEVAPGSTASVQDTGDGTSVSANFVWTGRYFDTHAVSFARLRRRRSNWAAA